MLEGDQARLLPAFAAPQQLDVYDIRSASYDIQLSVTTLAGLLNQQQPRVYLLDSDDADYWLKTALGHVPSTRAEAPVNAVLDTMIAKYRERIQGIIIYDPAVIDSVNVATTLAGLRGGFVVSPQVAATLQSGPHPLPLLENLSSYGWKDNLQVYRWAIEHVLPQASKQLVAGLDPRGAGALRSFLVATGAFVYWLDSRHIIPHLLHGLQSEHGMMQRIFQSYAPGTPHLGWFIDEGTGTSLASQNALPVLASDHFFNLEVWAASGQAATGASPTELDELSPLISIPAGKDDLLSAATKVYVAFTFSDGDNLQYDQHRLQRLWRDPARGSMPLGWTISPALVQAAPAILAYYQQTATANDEFIAGPSGAGYIYPSQWPAGQLPAFLELTGSLMRQMNLSALQVLDSTSGSRQSFVDASLQLAFANSLAPYGLRGILSGAGQPQSSWQVVDGVPIVQNVGLAGNIDQVRALIRNATPKQVTAPFFMNVYLLAWAVTPSDIKQVAASLDNRYAVVTPGLLMALIANTVI